MHLDFLDQQTLMLDIAQNETEQVILSFGRTNIPINQSMVC